MNSEKFQQQFVNNVKHILVDKGLNAVKLCSMAGVSQSHWSEIVSGKKKLTIDTLYKIADALNVEVTCVIKHKKIRA